MLQVLLKLLKLLQDDSHSILAAAICAPIWLIVKGLLTGTHWGLICVERYWKVALLLQIVQFFKKSDFSEALAGYL